MAAERRRYFENNWLLGSPFKWVDVIHYLGHRYLNARNWSSKKLLSFGHGHSMTHFSDNWPTSTMNSPAKLYCVLATQIIDFIKKNIITVEEYAGALLSRTKDRDKVVKV